MKVSIKDLSVAMEIKTKGIELDVYSPNGETHHGDLIVKKSGLTWCRGKSRVNVTEISWKKFIDWAETQV